MFRLVTDCPLIATPVDHHHQNVPQGFRHCIIVEGNGNKESACLDLGLQRQDACGIRKDDKISCIRYMMKRVIF